MARKPQVTEAAAAVATAGAIAVGGKLLHNRLAGDGDDAALAYRLGKDEPVGDGIRRIARAQLDGARDDLVRTPKRKLGEGVHEARKRVKRLRAALRLARGGLAEDVYARENAGFRDTGARLSGARDAEVMLETLDAVNERFADELPEERVAALRAALIKDHERETAALRADDGPIS